MGKNSCGGNKQKSMKNHVPRQRSVPINEIMPDGKTKFIGKITKKLGDSRMEVETFGIVNTFKALIPGSFKNRIWINIDDYVLIEISMEMSGANCFIIHKYDTNEINELKSLNVFQEKETLDQTGDIIFSNEVDDININNI